MTTIQDRMRPQDILVFSQIARTNNYFIIVRQTNPESLKYIGMPGFTPKPITCKPKTADLNFYRTLDNSLERIYTRSAGLVVNPEVTQEKAFFKGKYEKALKEWEKFKSSDLLISGHYSVQMHPRSIYYGCVIFSKAGILKGSNTIVLNPNLDIPKTASKTVSKPHGEYTVTASGNNTAILLAEPRTRNLIYRDPYLPDGTQYIHADYDLYAIIHAVESSQETLLTGVLDPNTKLEMVHNFNPIWSRMSFLINKRIGCDMIQHGTQELFGGHTHEALDMFRPDGKIEEIQAGKIQRLYSSRFNRFAVTDLTNVKNSGPSYPIVLSKSSKSRLG